jgi:hypothetical protein
VVLREGAVMDAGARRLVGVVAQRAGRRERDAVVGGIVRQACATGELVGGCIRTVAPYQSIICCRSADRHSGKVSGGRAARPLTAPCRRHCERAREKMAAEQARHTVLHVPATAVAPSTQWPSDQCQASFSTSDRRTIGAFAASATDRTPRAFFAR